MSEPEILRPSAPPADGEGRRSLPDGCFGRFLAIVIVVLGGIYLLNPGAGVGEFLPDFIPFVGNLDEAGIMALVVLALQHLFRRRPR